MGSSSYNELAYIRRIESAKVQILTANKKPVLLKIPFRDTSLAFGKT